jgi:hypothetical protein
MSAHPMYHDGSRTMQDRFDSRRIADRLELLTVHTELTADDAEFRSRAERTSLWGQNEG